MHPAKRPLSGCTARLHGPSLKRHSSAQSPCIVWRGTASTHLAASPHAARRFGTHVVHDMLKLMLRQGRSGDLSVAFSRARGMVTRTYVRRYRQLEQISGTLVLPSCVQPSGDRLSCTMQAGSSPRWTGKHRFLKCGIL